MPQPSIFKAPNEILYHITPLNSYHKIMLRPPFLSLCISVSLWNPQLKSRKVGEKKKSDIKKRHKWLADHQDNWELSGHLWWRGCRIMCLEQNKKAHGQRFHQHELEKLCSEENMRSSYNGLSEYLLALLHSVWDLWSPLNKCIKMETSIYLNRKTSISFREKVLCFEAT